MNHLPPRPWELAFLDRAARLAARSHGHVEPNPCVGCVIASPEGRMLAIAAHRRFGGPHAETLALAAAGPAARGAVAIVTLEPCAHHGKQPPCVDALIRAGVARVVYAVADPNPAAAGGAAGLRAAGIEVVHAAGHAASRNLAAPFVHRVQTGRPWVIAKWAQTLDGRIATRSGHSQWISGDRSRGMVHRQRGRVDAVLTGIGTVLADDPRLTPRHGGVRRTARRVVVDSDARTPPTGRLAGSLSAGPVSIAVRGDRLRADPEVRARAERLADLGFDILALPPAVVEPAATAGGAGNAGNAGGLGVDLTALLERLSAMNAATVLVEAGGRLVGGLLAAGLVQEAWVFTGPRLLGDALAPGPVAGLAPTRIDQSHTAELLDVRRRGSDLVCRWRIGSPASSASG